MQEEFIHYLRNQHDMETDKNDIRHIIADPGKVFRRISDGRLFGEEVYLGYTYYLNNEKLQEPFEELAEHFEEIDIPEDYLPNF